ncbi:MULTISPECIES: hypothetical protein [Paenibacillus]|uniref:hypothetical protein n=1 Tax=Paenibacillus TaxID=44249 RepID=UPI000422BBAB|nr:MULTISPECIES: hypothetical protein [Paenibacillus]KGP78109.1 hypothetical protein P364_0130100 [Paenibacillus sp. MAEPY2]KGP89369.1 hypothetical protein P363_0101550 [Paenibacillus sp. MAEPY1]OZQ71080.1 hypothetical protein CA599_11135 [Paenibacillus taichungensis]
MNIRYIAFKWHVDARIDAVKPVIEQLTFRPKGQNNWVRKINEHTLEIEHRVRMSDQERSYFWIRFSHPSGNTDKTALTRALSECFFAMNGHFKTYVNWLQVAFDRDKIRSVLGYTEKTSNIWTKTVDKQLGFTVYPIHNYYLFEVKNLDIRQTIKHQQYAVWIDEITYNLTGKEQPDDQIGFELVG